MAEESIEVKQEPFDEIIPLAATHRGDDVVNVVPSTGEIKEELSLEINNTTADGYVIYATEAFELSTESETRKRVSSSDPSKDFAAMQKKFKSTQQDSTEELRQWEAALKNDATINSTDAIMEYSDGSCHDISTLVSTEEGGETCHNDDDGYACDMRNSDESTPIITAPYTSDKQYESEFLNLLTKHKLKHYFAKLKDMNIGLDCLKAIREVDIKDMFGADIGARIRFRGLVDEWRATNKRHGVCSLNEGKTYKVVETIEDGERSISCVPASWEDCGILRWPNTRNVVPLIKRHTCPQENWLSLPCSVIKDRIRSYAEARYEEKWLSLHSDNDIKPDVHTKMAYNQLNANYCSGEITNSNCCCCTKVVRQTSPKQLASSAVCTLNNMPQVLQLFPSDATSPCAIPKPTNRTLHNNENKANIETKTLTTYELLNVIYKDLRDFKQNHAHLMKQIKEVKTLLRTTVRNELDSNFTPKESSEEIWFKENVPITTSDDLEAFNEKLGNPEFQDAVVRMFSKYASTDGKKNGKTSGYKIIDIIVKRQVIDLYTWTGSTKVKGVVKLPFLTLRNFINTIYKILLLSDYTWDENKNEDFLQKIIKHSKRRLEEEQQKLDSDRKCKKAHEIDKEQIPATSEKIPESSFDL